MFKFLKVEFSLKRILFLFKNETKVEQKAQIVQQVQILDNVLPFPKKKKKKSKSYYARKRARSFFWDNYTGPMKCWYCRDVVSREFPDGHPRKATIEHLIPLALGGSNYFKNLKVCCLECNHAESVALSNALQQEHLAA